MLFLDWCGLNSYKTFAVTITICSHLFHEQIWKSHMKESEENVNGDMRWREAIQWERPGRYSCDQRTPIKILQVDNTHHKLLSTYLKLKEENSHQQTKSNLYSSYQTPTNQYQPKLKHLHVHSASPRCLRQDELNYLKSQTPRLDSSYRNNVVVPSYMAETASAKARTRSLSVPREQRPPTPEREGIGIPKRRLYFGSSEEVPSPSYRNTTRAQR